MGGTHAPYSSIDLDTITTSASSQTSNSASNAVIGIKSLSSTVNNISTKQNLPPSPRANQHSRDYVLRTLLAGGIAGCAAKTAVAPLDRVKILFQVSNPSVRRHEGSLKGIFRAMRDLHGQHGIPGLFQGHGATILRIFPYAAIKFMAFEQFKAVLSSTRFLDRSSSNFIAGSLAGMTCVFFTYPMDLLRTRMAYEIERPLGIRAMSRVIYNEQNAGSISGILNFYRGFYPTLLGIVPYAGISFWSQGLLAKVCRDFFPKQTTIPIDGKPPSKHPLRGWAELTCGGLAGAIAQTISYPLEVIRRRMQVSAAVTSSRPTIAGVISRVYQQRGIRGFFAGLSIGYIKVTPMTAISFYTYAQMKRILKID